MKRRNAYRPRMQIRVRIDADNTKYVIRAAKEDRRSASNVVNKILADYFKQRA